MMYSLVCLRFTLKCRKRIGKFSFQRPNGNYLSLDFAHWNSFSEVLAFLATFQLTQISFEFHSGDLYPLHILIPRDQEPLPFKLVRLVHFALNYYGYFLCTCREAHLVASPGQLVSIERSFLINSLRKFL